MKEEIFGPILPILTFNDFSEVIKTINGMDKPLGIYYFGSNSWRNANMMRVKNETSSGAFLVNEMALHPCNPDLPFGGVGASGYGRTHGYEAFKQCSNIKSMMMKHPMNFYPFNVVFPPYTPDKQRIVNILTTHFTMTQSSMLKRTILVLVLLYILRLIVTKRLTVAKVKKFLKMAGMLLKIMFTK